MRTKVTLVLIFLNLALFYYIFVIRDEIVIDTTDRILGPEVANIQTLTITSPTAETAIRLERRGDKWFLTSPLVWPATETAVKGIVSELQFLRPEATFPVADLAKNGRTLAHYGLEETPLTIAFTPASVPGVPTPEPILLRIGAPTEVNNRLYVLSPDSERIHVVSRSLVESLTRSLEALRSDELFTIRVFEARSLNLEPAGGGRIRFRRDDDRWFTEGVIQNARASKVKTELALSGLRELRVRSFVPPTETDSIRPLLNNPALRITVEGNNRRETLLLGPPVPPSAQAPATPSADPAAPAPDLPGAVPAPGPSTLYYALMETTDATGIPAGRDTVFTVAVPDKFLETLRNAQRTLRERRVLDLDPSTLSAISLASPQTPGEIVLQRLEAPAASTWQIVRRHPDSAPQTEPADREIVERLISDLSRLSAVEPSAEGDSAFIDVPSEAQKEDLGFNRPARTITLIANGAAGSPTPAPVRLLVGVSHDRRTYAKLAHQEYIYRVPDEILRDVSVDPLHYRQRLLRELPPSTAITALKLTDPSNDTVLLDVTLPLPPAEADPASPDLRRAAIETLVAQLRTLRAREFTATAFTNTVTSSGEERPWKYRLDATLAPAGSENRTTSTLYFSERAGGATQFAGSPEFNVVFEVEQPLLDALFALTYGPRDPGPPAESVTPSETETAPPADPAPSTTSPATPLEPVTEPAAVEPPVETPAAGPASAP